MQLKQVQECYDNLNIGIVVFDRKGKEMYQNKKALEIAQQAGLSEGESTGLAALLSSYSDLDELWERVLANQGPQERFYLAPLTILSISVNKSDESECLVVGFHLTKQSEREAEFSARLSAIIESAVDGIITINERGVIQSMNPTALKLFQYTSADVLDKNIKMLMPNPPADQHDQYLHNYKAHGKKNIIGIGRMVEGMRKDGSSFPFHLSISEAVIKGTKVFTGFIHDESDKARAAEVSQALSKAKELNELKSQFISMASHEFRTPLSTILSSASLIEKYTTEEQHDKRQRHTDKIKRMVEHLKTILDDFLSVSKIEESKLEHKPIRFDVRAFLEEMIAEFQETIATDLLIDLEFSGEATGKYDQKLMTHIMHNLISNGIKYSNDSGVVNVTVQSLVDGIKIQVEDQGIGIPQEEQVNVFSRFFRASNASNIQGTGLGLNIIRSYVELMGGTIQFASKENEGTQFLIQLPSNA